MLMPSSLIMSILVLIIATALAVPLHYEHNFFCGTKPYQAGKHYLSVHTYTNVHCPISRRSSFLLPLQYNERLTKWLQWRFVMNSNHSLHLSQLMSFLSPTCSHPSLSSSLSFWFGLCSAKYRESACDLYSLFRDSIRLELYVCVWVF